MQTEMKVLIFQGGWDGHEPKLVSARYKAMLEKHGYDVTVTDTLETLDDADMLMGLDLIVACWTMGSIEHQRVVNISKAVANGTGLAGCHGGMCDSFRQDTEWQFMTGGQWVSHPGGDGINYRVNVRRGSSPIVEGVEDFDVCSEHYYHISNKPVDMPVVWTKYWGNGRVFYNSLGHHDDVFDKSPSAGVLMERGLVWAAEGKQYAIDHNLTTERFENTAKMY